jgi:hypothetical protein
MKDGAIGNHLQVVPRKATVIRDVSGSIEALGHSFQTIQTRGPFKVFH